MAFQTSACIRTVVISSSSHHSANFSCIKSTGTVFPLARTRFFHQVLPTIVTTMPKTVAAPSVLSAKRVLSPKISYPFVTKTRVPAPSTLANPHAERIADIQSSIEAVKVSTDKSSEQHLSKVNKIYNQLARYQAECRCAGNNDQRRVYQKIEEDFTSILQSLQVPKILISSVSNQINPLSSSIQKKTVLPNQRLISSQIQAKKDSVVYSKLGNKMPEAVRKGSDELSRQGLLPCFMRDQFWVECSGATKTIQMNEQQRKLHEVGFQGNGFLSRSSSSDPSLISKDIFVVGPDKKLYLSPTVSRMHHSSFLKGGAVLGAGEIKTDPRGKVLLLTNRSGHYSPNKAQTLQMLRYFLERGVNLKEVMFDDFNTHRKYNAWDYLERGLREQGISLQSLKRFTEEAFVKSSRKYDRQVILNLGSGNTAAGLGKKAWEKNQLPTDTIELRTGLPDIRALGRLTGQSRLYIVGHCLPGSNSISSDEGVRYTVEDYVRLIKMNNPALQGKGRGGTLTVSVVSCFSGSSNGIAPSFAQRLSQALAREGIQAKVLGRTGAVSRWFLTETKGSFRKCVEGKHHAKGEPVSNFWTVFG